MAAFERVMMVFALAPVNSYWFLEDGYEVDLATGQIVGEGIHVGPPSKLVQRILNRETERKRTLVSDSKE
jgi:hypothetical protein